MFVTHLLHWREADACHISAANCLDLLHLHETGSYEELVEVCDYLVEYTKAAVAVSVCLNRQPELVEVADGGKHDSHVVI